MALKTKLTKDEEYGLSREEIKLATRWLRKHKTAGVIPELEAAKIFELYLLGEPLVKLAQIFPQYPLGQIAFTAAYKQWAKDRDRMLHTLKDRVQAKVIKSVMDQVDFLTTMMAVTNAEHLQEMQKYVMDPENNPKPVMRITNIKEYRDITDTLLKIVSGATGGGGGSNKPSPMMAALSSHTSQRQIGDAPKKEEEEEISILDV